MDTFEQTSLDWLRRAGEYRTLVGKRDQLGYPLGPVEAARLDELARFFLASAPAEQPAFAAREQTRAPIALLVTFSAGKLGQRTGDARDLSGEGMFITTEEPLPVGTRTIVRIIDRFRGDDWRFGAEVVRLSVGPRAGMGVRFVGIPLLLRLGHRARPRAPELKHAA